MDWKLSLGRLPLQKFWTVMQLSWIFPTPFVLISGSGNTENAFHIWFISYIINTNFFHGNIWPHNWPAPNVSGFIAQLVEHRTGIARSRVQTPLKSWFFFSGFFTQLHKLRSLRWSFLHFHFIPTVFIYYKQKAFYCLSNGNLEYNNPPKIFFAKTNHAAILVWLNLCEKVSAPTSFHYSLQVFKV